MSFEKYSNYLIKSAIVVVIVCLIVIVVLCVALFYVKKICDDDKPMQLLITFISFLCILGAIIFGGWRVYNTIYDVQNQSYIIYEGIFQKDTTALFIFDSNGKKKSLSIDKYAIPKGEYEGKIIYSERTETVVDFMIYN